MTEIYLHIVARMATDTHRLWHDQAAAHESALAEVRADVGSAKAEIGEVRSEQKKLAAVTSDKTAALSGLHAELSGLRVRGHIIGHARNNT